MMMLVLTVVNTPWGLYEWVVMPMGIKNTLAIHQRCISIALWCHDSPHTAMIQTLISFLFVPTHIPLSLIPFFLLWTIVLLKAVSSLSSLTHTYLMAVPT
jgi:hypothetical protein